MSLAELAEKLYPVFIRNSAENIIEPCRLFLSATNMNERATVCHAVCDTPEEAWENALDDLEKILAQKNISPVILRADWVIKNETKTWAQCLALVGAKRRNWFRQGIALDPSYKLAFTEQELNANLFFFNPDKEKTKGEFQPANAELYCKQRFGCSFPQMSDDTKVAIFDTAGAFIQDGMSVPLTLASKGADIGRRNIAEDNSEVFLNMAMDAAKYLVTQCEPDGKFIYGLYPCNDSIVPSYNTHRHFGTLFSMAEAYEFCADETDKKALGNAIENGLEYGVKNLLRYAKTSDGKDIAYFIEGRATTIGISGLSLLAFTKWTTLTGTQKYISLMQGIARGIIAVQKPEGNFTQILNAADFSVRKDFSITFYDGEALFGLLRLYAITKEPELLEAVERAVAYFRSVKYWEHHDHWMQYTLNELTIYKPKAEYFKFGLDNISSYLPKIARSVFHSPTQLEMVMAAENMIRRMKLLPEMDELIKRVNDETLYSTADKRAERMENSYFWSEVAMYFQNPARMVGSFFIRGDAFRVRIDDVQHTISGLISYNKCLSGEDVPFAPVKDIVEEKPAATVDSQTNRIVIGGDVRVTIETENNSLIAFDNGQPQLVSNVEPPLTVGIMKRVKNHFWEPSNARYPMFLMAKHFNIELLFFNPEDVDFDNGTVKAITLENGKVVHKVSPIPKIIDNDIALSRGETLEIMRRLKERAYFIRPIGAWGKQKFYTEFSREGSFNEFLIETHTLESFEHFLTLFEKYGGNVILKPARGVGGGGVAKIKFADGKYIATAKTKTFILENTEALSKYYAENFAAKKYLLQPYVASKTRQGNPFDIRIHARRGAEGKYKTFLYPRIGNPAGVISNVVAGGFTMNLEAFLQTEFGNDWRKVHNQLTDLAARFPDYYQSFYNDTIFDIGIDVGIQKRGDVYELKLFEAYIQPGFTLIRDEVAVTNFEYYRYIAQKISKAI